MIEASDWAGAIDVALEQVRGGANVLDVNMDADLLDGEEAMRTFLNVIATEPEVARLPIMVDSSRWSVIEAGLQSIQGKGIVNSISLKEGEEAFLEQARRIRDYGASEVLDYHDDWPALVHEITGGGAPKAVNAAPGQEANTLNAVADGGRLATITGDPPPSQRGIQLVDAYVAPDGLVLEAAVGQLLARGQTIPIAGIYGLGDAAIALRTVVQGRAEGACVLDPAR